MAELQAEIDRLKTELADRTEPAAATAIELPDRWTFKSRLITKLPLFKQVKKKYEQIEDTDAQIILDVLEELL